MTYQTSDEGMRKIRYDLLKKMPLKELESLGINNPKDNLVREVLKEAFFNVQTNLEKQRILSLRHPFEGS
jgi:hypothetical protein